MGAAPRIARVGIRAWELPLARPLRAGGATLDHRQGLLLLLEDEAGHSGVGEAAPLPGLHAESAQEAGRQLLAVAAALEGEAIPGGCAALDGAFSGWLGRRALHPCVRSAVEGAALSLLADTEGLPLPRLLAGNPAPAVRVNALLAGDVSSLVEEAERRATEGYRCLKIKVGRGDPEAEARAVRDVRRAVGDSIALRLDANRAWDLGTAVAFARRVEPFRIAYVEEPLRDPGGLERFAASTSLSVALDETLLGLEPTAPGTLPGVSAFVLKPEVLGGFEAAAAWARAARARGLDAVVSAAFPSAAGLALAAAFAASLGGETAHGLGTFSAFAADLARTPILAPGGRIDVSALPLRAADLRLELTRVLR